ncbi:BREX-1 system adenine-specific DNA-methyltransferase PglX [Bradyrhizobium sp. CAR08]
MNRNALETYAPKARREFIAAVTARAAKIGVTADGAASIRREGDYAIIGGTAFPAKVAFQRNLLDQRIQTKGFDQVVDAAAYTWFNRFAAIRFMEIHGYLDHGYRVLSHPAGDPTPEILQHADQVELPGLGRKRIIELRLDGQKDEELYRLILIAQCNALNTAMPFLFERIDDETELLLPDNLLHTDSLIRQMVSDIEEDDWKEIEIIGWLYQYYVAQRHEEVIGKVVKSEDIPAATQLFTPNWVVKYMVQNSLGAQWLAGHPESPLKEKMAFYIEPPLQSDDVQRMLAAFAPPELDPEKLTMIDPACGSGHILVEGYDLLKEIYLEQGYTLRQIPRLILQKNIFGLDIDDRAAQLAGFALVMKARADDRRLFAEKEPPQINVMALQETNSVDLEHLIKSIVPDVRRELIPADDLMPDSLHQPILTITERPTWSPAALRELVGLFVDAKTAGSLIVVPDTLVETLPQIAALLDRTAPGDLVDRAARAEALGNLRPIVKQAEILARKYSVAVANPPYMGSKFFNRKLKEFVEGAFQFASSDLYAYFLERTLALLEEGGQLGMISIPSWMFLSTYSEIRRFASIENTITSLVHNGRGVFGSDHGSVSFVIQKVKLVNYRGAYKRLFDKQGSVSGNAELRNRFFESRNFTATSGEFQAVPGSPISYWISDRLREMFQGSAISAFAEAKQGLSTSDNKRFVRLWHEVPYDKIGFGHDSEAAFKECGAKWAPYNKGGLFRKWYGNNEFVVLWENGGAEIKGLRPKSVVRSPQLYFRPSATWSDVTSAKSAFRYQPQGYIFANSAHSCFPTENGDRFNILGFLNTKLVYHYISALSPSLHFDVGYFALLPYSPIDRRTEVDRAVTRLVDIARSDWDRNETSWDFQRHPFLDPEIKQPTIERTFAAWDFHCQLQISDTKSLEEQNNRLFIEAYNLQDELDDEVPVEEVTLLRADRSADAKSLISYAVGCLLSRYSLDRPGLALREPNSSKSEFASDTDGIIPVTDEDWFEEDAANQFRQFVRAAWDQNTVENNLKFIADSLGVKPKETPVDTIRRYLSREFYKDHLQSYRNRPIYWLFSSGKEKAFECLVYVHRYAPGTLSRMRMEYVIPLQGRMRAKAEQIKAAVESSASASGQTKMRKELEKLTKRQAELVKFDEELRHFADLRINLDLDDGVRVNYAKFGNLLAEVKKVSGDDDE